MKSAFMFVILMLVALAFSQDFTEVSIGLPGVDRSSIAWGDYDNDGDLDIVLSGDSTTEVFRNDNGVFIDINAGLLTVGYGSVEWGDYDDDGDLDILISGYNGTTSTKIYRNTSGIFSDANVGLPGILHGVSAWADYDNDGDLDVFVTGNTGSLYISRLYRNDSGVFNNSNISFPGLIYSFAKWGDYDNDNDQDLILTGYTGSSRITRIYNNYNSNFTSISHSLPSVESGPMDWGDYDNDGDLDIILTGWDGSNVITEVYKNTNGVFSSLSAGMTKMYAGYATWGDYDNDGDQDVLVNGYSAIGFYTKIYKNNDGMFSDISGGFTGLRWGWSKFGDYDNDGDNDFIVTGNSGGSGITKLYKNNFTSSAAIPSEPIAINATDIISTGFKARWNTSSYATGYFLDVAKDSVFTDFVAGNQNIDVGNYDYRLVTGLIPETIYYYRVRAYNGYGTSGNSNTVKVHTYSTGTIINPPLVSGVWEVENSPYYICGDITIPNGEVLNIEPGCEIIFQGHYRIIVQGCLEAVGNERDSITFRASNSETGWMGIRFINTPAGNPKSQIGYCVIKNGNANILGGTESYGGAISVENFSKLDIFNNLFTNNRAGAGSAINCNNFASPNIYENVFSYNRAGYETGSGYGTVNCMFNSAPTINNNLFEHNWLIGENYCAGAAIRCAFDSNPMIKNNIIRENYIISDGNLSEGTAMYIHSSDPIIMNNLIYDNYIDPPTGHGSGGAIFFYDSNSKLINNTIRTNSAREGGALWFKLSSPDFHNNIIRGNEAATLEQQIFFDDDASDPNFYHNNIEGGKENFGFKYPEYTFTGAWVNNIDEDPKYEDNGNGLDYNLASDSPCIDAGTLDFTAEIPLEELDLLSNERVFGQTIDIGAIESFIASPSNLSMVKTDSAILLTWDIIPSAASYKIYSSDEPYGTFVLENTVSSNSYQIDLNQAVKKFYYIKSSN